MKKIKKYKKYENKKHTIFKLNIPRWLDPTKSSCIRANRNQITWDRDVRHVFSHLYPSRQRSSRWKFLSAREPKASALCLALSGWVLAFGLGGEVGWGGGQIGWVRQSGV
jgi:hypothetical protein